MSFNYILYIIYYILGDTFAASRYLKEKAYKDSRTPRYPSLLKENRVL